MDTVFIVRIILALTFLITAAGFPVAIIIMRRFIKLYTRKHGELHVEVDTLRAEVRALASRVANLEPVDGL